MKRLMISAFAAVALLAAATNMLRSHSPSTDGLVATAGMPSLQELQSAADVNKLPTGEFEDRSLVYSTETKH
jgi:hypothetical protein